MSKNSPDFNEMVGPSSRLVRDLRNMELQLEQLCQFQRMRARLRREHYLALLEQGFTEQQALELCRFID